MIGNTLHLDDQDGNDRYDGNIADSIAARVLGVNDPSSDRVPGGVVAGVLNDACIAAIVVGVYGVVAGVNAACAAGIPSAGCRDIALIAAGSHSGADCSIAFSCCNAFFLAPMPFTKSINSSLLFITWYACSIGVIPEPGAAWAAVAILLLLISEAIPIATGTIVWKNGSIKYRDWATSLATSLASCIDKFPTSSVNLAKMSNLDADDGCSVDANLNYSFNLPLAIFNAASVDSAKRAADTVNLNGISLGIILSIPLF